MKVRNRLKGLDLIVRVPDELWTEVCNIVQETRIKTIPKEKKCKKAKWLSEEALQIAVKRREARSKGEKDRYKHLNAEFQRIARRDKKTLLMPVQVQCTILDAWGWCSGTTQRDGMEREDGGGFRMGNTCIPVVDSC